MIDFFFKGGLLMWPILLCSVLALGVTVTKAVQYWRVMKELSLPLEQLRGAAPKLLMPLLDAWERGSPDHEISFLGTRQIKDLEKGLGALSLISVITPLLGLTGTVTGMIRAFQTIAVHESQVNPGLLATGIWEALITTAAGLFVAIPAHVAYHLLEERLEDIALTFKGAFLELSGRRNGEF